MSPPCDSGACSDAHAAAAPRGRELENCLRCGNGITGAASVTYMALVPHASIFDVGKQCKHGPYCEQCAVRKEDQTLPLCECRALVTGWSPPLQPSKKRPNRKSPAGAVGASVGAASAEVVPPVHHLRQQQQQQREEEERQHAEREPLHKGQRHSFKSAEENFQPCRGFQPYDAGVSVESQWSFEAEEPQTGRSEEEVSALMKRALAAVERLSKPSNTPRLHSSTPRLQSSSGGCISGQTGYAASQMPDGVERDESILGNQPFSRECSGPPVGPVTPPEAVDGSPQDAARRLGEVLQMRGGRPPTFRGTSSG